MLRRRYTDFAKQFVKSPRRRDQLRFLLADLVPFHRRLGHAQDTDQQLKLYVGSHHKTGTVWLQSVFKLFAHLSDSSFEHLGPRGRSFSGRRHHVIFDYHAKTPADGFGDARGFRMVRDPRDVLLSAMKYHQRSIEVWLHQPREDFGGLTYQEKIKSFSSDEDKLRFELDHATGKGVREMVAFDGQDKVRTVKYEDMIDDAALVHWHEILRWSGLERFDLLLAQQALLERSLFGLEEKGGKHITSSSTRQWDGALGDQLTRWVEDAHPGALARLGYAETKAQSPGLASA